MRLSAEEHGIVHREAVGMAMLGDEGDLLRAMPSRHLRERRAVKQHYAAVGLQRIVEAGHERRLSASVHAENRQKRSGLHQSADGFQDRTSLDIGVGDLFCFQHQRLTPLNSK